ncbi:unnamed protein product, partial [Mesorhabditis spiculigera]
MMGRWHLLILGLSANIGLLEACFSLGGCGFGGCLGLPAISIGSFPSCGRFCRRAKGSKTLSGEEVHYPEDDIQEEPDVMFQKCCAEAKLPKACMDKCSFRTYTKDALTAMFFKTDTCPIEMAVDIHRCAAQLNDHRECCKNQGVQTTLAGGKCQLFCDQRPSPNVTHLDMTFLPCLERFDNMKACFWHDANKRHLDYLTKQKAGQISQQNEEMEEFEAAPPSQKTLELTDSEVEDDRDEDSSHETQDPEDDIDVQIRHLNRDEADGIEIRRSGNQEVEPESKPWYMSEQ